MTDVFLVLNSPGTVDVKGSMKSSIATTVITPSGGAGDNYFYGFNLTFTSATTVSVGIGSASLANGSSYYKITSTAVLPISCRVFGVGGLDTGTFTPNWYYAWIIVNPTTNAISTLFSLSATAPTMPTGYTLKRRIGSVLIYQEDGLIYIRTFFQSGNGPTKTYVGDGAFTILVYNSTSSFIPIPTSASGACPQATSLTGTAKINTAVAADTCILGPGAIGVLDASIAGPAPIAKLTLACASGVISFRITSDSGETSFSIAGTGWTEEL